VGLNLEHKGVIIIEADNTRIVLEYRQAVIPVSQVLAHLFRRTLDAGLEQGVNLFVVTVFIMIINGRGKDFMFAVFRPGLGQCLQLHVRGIFREPKFPSFPANPGLTIIFLDNLHLFERKGQNPFPAYRHKLFIGYIEINLPDHGA